MSRRGNDLQAALAGDCGAVSRDQPVQRIQRHFAMGSFAGNIL